ncbi:MAG: hypothetical protein IJO68_05340 [Clostridia bacterium]|nr:hypothetical protein [Clostridia bacterium]
MKAKKILALVLTAIIVFSCSACTTIELVIPVGNLPAQNTNTTPSVEQTTAAPAPVQPEQTTAAPAPQEQTTAAQQTPSQETTTAAPAPQETTTAAPAPSTGVPSTKAEIVKFYCDAYNKLGTASAITRTYDYTSNYNNILDIDGGNSTLAGIANKLMGMFMVENTDPLVVDVNALPPVGISNLNIDPNVIADAKCTDKGDHYEVILYSTGTAENREQDSQPGTGSVGSFGPLLRSEDVSGAAAGFIEFTGLHSLYERASVTAKITKDGKITDLSFETPCILHFDSVSAIKIINVGVCEIGLLFQQTYTIAY